MAYTNHTMLPVVLAGAGDALAVARGGAVSSWYQITSMQAALFRPPPAATFTFGADLAAPDGVLGLADALISALMRAIGGGGRVTPDIISSAPANLVLWYLSLWKEAVEFYCTLTAYA
jgi:hypothetical protein